MNKLVIDLSIIFILVLSGCITTSDKKPMDLSLQNYLNNVEVKSEYNVKHTYDYCSSGGCRSWDIQYEIQNKDFTSCGGSYHFDGMDEKTEECTLELLQIGDYPFNIQKSIINVVTELKSFDFSNSKSINFDERICFYDISSEQYTKILVCFDGENIIVNYAGSGAYGGGKFFWNINGYEFTDQISSLVISH